MSRTLVITALEIEAKALRSVCAGRAELLCTGPGPACAEALRSRAERPLALLLAGLAGGLSNDPPALVRTVIDDATGVRFTPHLARDDKGAVLVTVRDPVSSPALKRSLGQRHDAHLVDCEAAHAARACAALNVRWGVVRTVSDGVDHQLPAQAADWIDARGRTRTGRVLTDTLARPSLIPELRRLARNSKHALKELAPLVDHALNQLAR